MAAAQTGELGGILGGVGGRPGLGGPGGLGGTTPGGQDFLICFPFIGFNKQLTKSYSFKSAHNERS